MLTETVLEVQNRHLRQENEELRETVRQLREAALSMAPLPVGLPHLTPHEVCALRALLSRKGVISKRSLYLAIYGTEDGPDEKLIDVWVCKLRPKIAAAGLGIRTIWGTGYEMIQLPERQAA